MNGIYNLSGLEEKNVKENKGEKVGVIVTESCNLLVCVVRVSLTEGRVGKEGRGLD